MTSAKKRTLIFNPPAILTVHLKRFKEVRQTICCCFMHDGSTVISSFCMDFSRLVVIGHFREHHTCGAKTSYFKTVSHVWPPRAARGGTCHLVNLADCNVGLCSEKYFNLPVIML